MIASRAKRPATALRSLSGIRLSGPPQSQNGGAARCPTGRSGQSRVSAGRITAQSAKLIVRAQRNMPSALVGAGEPVTANAHAEYAASGASPAAATRSTGRQPMRRSAG